MTHPNLVFKKEDAEVFMTAPNEYRLYYRGDYVTTFKSAVNALYYIDVEFCIYD